MITDLRRSWRHDKETSRRNELFLTGSIVSPLSVRIGTGVTYAKEEKQVDYLMRENIGVDEICKREIDGKIEEVRENEEEKKKEKNGRG